MNLDPDAIREELDKLGEDWADKNAAAVALEETKSVVLAEQSNQLRELLGSQAAAESAAKASILYGDHITAMVEARRVANRARVKYDSMKALVELKRTQASTERAAMTLR